jgi:UDP-3-O-[3-hydroxymyristoyl] glucosamine N-acyltransferase
VERAGTAHPIHIRKGGAIVAHHTAGELAKVLGCALDGDSGAVLHGVASPERAGAEDLVYTDSDRHNERVARSAACCVVAMPGLRVPGKTLLTSSQPKVAFARAAALLAPPVPIARGIHGTAVLAPSVSLGEGVAIGPFAVIEEEVTIGPGTEVGAFCYLGRGVRLGGSCRLHPRVTLYAGARLGERVIVHSGAVLGADGFGYVTDQGQHWKFPQVGTLEIGDDVEIGANTTIDRGSLERTILGAQVKLDNLVHVAHNVRVGERTLIAAQTGIAGSSDIGADVVIGGQVGIADHCRLEDSCTVGAQAGIPTGKAIRRGQTVWGTPARQLARFKEQYAWLIRLPDLAQRLRNLEGKESGKG